MITLVKFIDNPDPDSRNPMISKTLGKYGVLETAQYQKSSSPYPLEEEENCLPKSSEFWKVEIIKEVIIHRKHGTTGCFILKPISKVGYKKVDEKQEPDIDYLIPGGYATKKFKTSLVIIPQTLGFNWVAGLDIRHHLRDQYMSEDGYGVNSFIVSLDGSTEWKVEEIGLDGIHSGSESTIYSK